MKTNSDQNAALPFHRSVFWNDGTNGVFRKLT